MTAVIGGTLIACGLIMALAVADAPMLVVAGAAFGMLGLTAAWARLRGRLTARYPWTGQDEAILRGDLTAGAWERAGQAARGERR